MKIHIYLFPATLNKTLLITITTLAAVAVLLMLVILLIMLVRMRRAKKVTDGNIKRIPQVQSPIVPVHVTETKKALDEADTSGDILKVFCFDQKQRFSINAAPRQSAPRLGQRQDDVESGTQH